MSCLEELTKHYWAKKCDVGFLGRVNMQRFFLINVKNRIERSKLF